MNEQISINGMAASVNMKRLLDAVRHKIWCIILAAVLGSAITIACTYFFVTPLYQSSAMFYVNNSAISVGDTSLSISSADISASKSLVDTYITILNTRETLNKVIDHAGVDRSYTDVRDMVEAAAVNETEIFRVVVTSPDPAEAEKIASSIAYILPNRISSIVEGTSAKIVDSAVVPTQPSSPSYPNNAVLGFLLGAVLSGGYIVLRELFDVTIRAEEDITQLCQYPILAAVPDMAAPSKGSSYYYGYGSNRIGTKNADANRKQISVIGADISFASAEAYKLLRTKLQFSFADDENRSRVIGFSSALSGEGKSLTAVNLAYTLSQIGKRVILLDSDMRRPTIAEKLNIQNKPGLSNCLSGQAELSGLIQPCGLKKDEEAFHVISAGESPPNPIELLSSRRMHKVLETLCEHYDYVILDLPPIGEVSDAMAVAKDVDGMLLLVRQDYCNRPALSNAIRQLEFVEAKILGVVYNCAQENGEKYRYGMRSYRGHYEKNGVTKAFMSRR